MPGAGVRPALRTLREVAKRSIGPDKVNQLRHALFLCDADGVRAHMARHRELLRPKFDAVQQILTEQLGDTDLASWSTPKGGYFVSLRVPPRCAREIVRRAAETGIALKPAGATHPYGHDPRIARSGSRRATRA